MRLRFRVSPQAGRQIRAATKWWIENRTAAPTMLANELEAAFELIADMPYAGEAVPHSQIKGVRRVLLGGTQYHVYYIVSENDSTVEVLALWHTSRGKPPRL